MSGTFPAPVQTQLLVVIAAIHEVASGSVDGSTIYRLKLIEQMAESALEKYSQTGVNKRPSRTSNGT